MKSIFLFFVIFLVFSCGNTKESKDFQTNNNISASMEDTNFRFIVSFISIGSGIDIKSKKDFEQFIKEFEVKNNVNISFDKKYKGREGEVNFCFSLNELNSDDQDKFILESRTRLNSSANVQFFENNPKNKQ